MDLTNMMRIIFLMIIICMLLIFSIGMLLVYVEYKILKEIDKK